MNERITAAERDLASLKTDVAVIRSNYVIKEDLQRELHNHTWRIIGAIAALTAAVFHSKEQSGSTPPDAASGGRACDFNRATSANTTSSASASSETLTSAQHWRLTGTNRY